MIEDTHQLGKYRILEELGKGGFATVYRALDTTLEREVALKVLDPLLMRDDAWVERFRREAKAVAKLNHPHIVTIYEVDEADGRLFIAMELVQGPTLKDLIAERGRLSWEETLNILTQVAEALDYAHGEGVLHRDLKPGNVLFDPRKGAMLTDFGFAKLVGESSMSVSVSGGIIGTPSYIAPEIWDGKEVTAQTDLYALACIAYEMLTGEVLFGGETPMQVMRAHDRGPQFPAVWPEGVPEGVAKVLRRALAQEAGARYHSAKAMTGTLRGVARPKPVVQPAAESVAPSFVQTASLPRRRRRVPVWAWGIGVLVVLALLLCIGVALVGPQLIKTAPESTDEVPTRFTEVPTETPRMQSTDEPVEIPTVLIETLTLTPKPAPKLSKPDLVTPSQGAPDVLNPVTFTWGGELGYGQTYQVIAWHVDAEEELTEVESESIQDPVWETHLPAEKAGEWHWQVRVVQDGAVLAESEEGMFWFQPIPAAPTSVPTLSPVKPELASPSQGAPDLTNPIVFTWEGVLRSGQAYQVAAWHVDEKGEKTYVQSDPIQDPHWEAHLPAEKAGEWHWQVWVIQGGVVVVAESEEGMFWFNPFPGGGDEPKPTSKPEPPPKR